MMKLPKYILSLIAINICLVTYLIFIVALGDELNISELPNGDSSAEFINRKENELPPPYVNYLLINEKALFHRSRKPLEFEEVEEKATEKVRTVLIGDFILQGIVFTGDHNSVAYLTNRRSKAEYELKVSEIFEGWRVKEIYRNYINLENGGQLAKLNLLNEE